MNIEEYLKLNAEDLKNQIDRLFGRTDLTNNETNSIISCLEKFDSPKYLEIGVYFGGTFSKILEFLKINKTEYYCCGVDLFEELLNDIEKYDKRFEDGIESQTHVVFHEFNVNHGGKVGGRLNISVMEDLKEKLDNLDLKNYELFKGYSDKLLPTLKNKFDVIFIDGNHTYLQTLKDFENSFSFLSKKGTYFVFHNTTENEKNELYKDGGPFQVCNELLENKKLQYIGMFDTTKIFKRIK
jgi:hypothetical protein